MILVTGSTGFLGRRVCKLLDLRGLPYLRTPRSLDLDLTDERAVHGFWLEHRPSHVIHCASYGGGIQFNFEHPTSILRRNILMTLNLWDICNRTACKRIVNPVANCAYPGSATVFREDEFWDGPLHDSVLATGFTRKASVVASWAYARESHLDTINLVLPNLYGPEDHFDEVRSHALGALVAKTVRAKLRHSDYVDVWGTGTPVREWLYVDDAAEALIRALDCPPHEGIANVGVERGISVRELAEMIRRSVGFTGQLRFDASKPDGAPHKTVEGSLGRKLLGWSPRVGLAEGIKMTVAWVLAHPEVLK